LSHAVCLLSRRGIGWGSQVAAVAASDTVEEEHGGGIGSIVTCSMRLVPLEQ